MCFLILSRTIKEDASLSIDQWTNVLRIDSTGGKGMNSLCRHEYNYFCLPKQIKLIIVIASVERQGISMMELKSDAQAF